MKLAAEQINHAISGFTDVSELSLSINHREGKYDMTLVLSNSKDEIVILKCQDVSNLRVSDFGGGLTQFMCLRSQDVSERQLDRVCFQFVELEKGAIAFHCASAECSEDKIRSG